MTDLDQLGQRHRELQAELAAIREKLAPAIREERGKGATYVELMTRSGYSSIETIRNILDPNTRDRNNRARRTA